MPLIPSPFLSFHLNSFSLFSSEFLFSSLSSGSFTLHIRVMHALSWIYLAICAISGLTFYYIKGPVHFLVVCIWKKWKKSHLYTYVKRFKKLHCKDITQNLTVTNIFNIKIYVCSISKRHLGNFQNDLRKIGKWKCSLSNKTLCVLFSTLKIR